MASEEWDDMVLVGRIARAHGNKCQVIVNPETDFPEDRFQEGREVLTRQAGSVRRLAISAVRFQRGRPVVAFTGVETMDDAEALAGAELKVPSSELGRLPQGTYYHHELIGCEVRRADGATIGRVKAVEGPTAGSLLVVDTRRGEVLIPLAGEICVRVDPAARVIVIEPPEGLLELNERGRWREES
jgi:16S rRNA processing protein RimM